MKNPPAFSELKLEAQEIIEDICLRAAIRRVRQEMQNAAAQNTAKNQDTTYSKESLAEKAI